jgi:hypothetical protein
MVCPPHRATVEVSDTSTRKWYRELSTIVAPWASPVVYTYCSYSGLKLRSSLLFSPSSNSLEVLKKNYLTPKSTRGTMELVSIPRKSHLSVHSATAWIPQNSGRAIILIEQCMVSGTSSEYTTSMCWVLGAPGAGACLLACRLKYLLRAFRIFLMSH